MPCPASPGPGLMPVRCTICCPAFTATLAGVGDKSSVGAWLTGVTVTMKVWVVEAVAPPLMPLSVTVTVIVAVPLALGTGVKTTDPTVFGLV